MEQSWSNEHGYFRSISSGRDFQFVSAHFCSKSRTDTRVGAFDRYTLPTYGKIIEKICNIKKEFFRYTEVGIFQSSGPSKQCKFQKFLRLKIRKKILQNDPI